MAQQTINIGASPNDGTGTPLRTSFDYTNQNFTELYTATGPSGNNIVVPGNATITGDLTVATNGLKVDSANKNVGINTATPTNTAGYKTLEIVGTGVNTAGMLRFKSSDTSVNTLDFADSNGRAIFAISNHPVRFGCNDIEQYRIAPLGVFNWYNGAGGTRMTLDSTGLGIGAVANAKLDVAGAATVVDSRGQLYIHTTDAAAIDVGAQLTLGGVYTGSNNYAFGGIAARKENGTTNVAGYLDFLTTTSAGALTSRMRINSTGQVGIGITPTNAYSTSRALQIGQGGLIEGRTNDYTTFSLATNAYLGSAGDWTYSSNAAANLYAQSNGAFTWASAAAGTGVATFTPAMTLNASGNLLVNTTSQILSAKVSLQTDGSRGYSYNDTAGGAGTKAIIFGSLGVEVGSVSVTTLTTTYNTTSDYRLKESVQPLVGGLTRINSLKPSIYNWKSNGSAGEGFIAHELADVVPAAVTGKKDAVNEDGTISPQSIDMSRIVPILVAAIQELTAEVNALKNA